MAETAGEPSRHRISRPLAISGPVLASIGTVLIDAFDSPPRPVLDTPMQAVNVVSSPGPDSGPSSGPSTPLSLSKSQQLAPHPIPMRLVSPMPSPSGSGPSTPQLSFDDMPTPNAEDVCEMLGGGALYALVGARLWLPPTTLKTLVDRASETEPNDLPPDAEDKLKTLGEDIWVWNRGQGTRMTRARIRYEGDVRYFHPVVKAPYRTISQLLSTPLNQAEYLHISPPYSPEDVHELLRELETLNGDNTGTTHLWSPKIVFEPTPPSCHPRQKEWLERILPGIYILSPNHEELFSFYSVPSIPSPSADGQTFDPSSSPESYIKRNVETIVDHLLHDVGIWKDGTGIIVIRCGRLGACVATKKDGLRWCPAYFDDGPSGQSRVVDVTGAGNSFLGGYVAGLSLTNEPYQALLHATISASFIVEQFGLPSLSTTESGEEWNGVSPSRRLEELRDRLEWA